MKVAHFITRMIVGGAQENTLFTVLDQIRDYGDEVVLISGVDRGREGDLLDRAREGGADVRVIESLGRAIRPWSDWTSYRELLVLLNEIRPDLLHTHSSKAGILGRAAAHKLKIPVVHTIHGAAFHYGQSRPAHWLYRRAERWAARRTDRFISVCDAMTEQYLAAGIGRRERYTTIYSGMEVEPLLNPAKPPAETRARLGLSPEHLVVGKVARLFPLKGHQYLIQAAPAIVAAFPQVRFLLVGDGILREQYQQAIARAGLTEHFHFVGLVAPDEVPELIHAMDALVHTSEWEGLARVLPQALIAGKPAVSFAIDGAPEVIVDGETGCLVPFGDVNRLADAVNRLLADPELRTRMGAAGRARWTEPFRHQTMTRRIREVYAQLLTERTG